MSTENTRVAAYLPKDISTYLKDFKSERNINSDSKALIVILSEFFKVTHSIDDRSESQTNDILERLRSIESKLVDSNPVLDSTDLAKYELLSSLVSELNNKVSILESELLSKLKSELNFELLKFQDKTKSELLNELEGSLKSRLKSDSHEQLNLGEEIVPKPVKVSKPRTRNRSAKKKEIADGENTLNLTQIATRLGVKNVLASSVKSKYKNNVGGFTNWSRSKDPDGYGWEFKSGSDLFYKVTH